MVWDHWVPFYQSDNKLLRRTLVWEAALLAKVTPTPLEVVLGPVDDFLDGQGKALTEDLDIFEATQIPDTKLLQLRLRTLDTKKNRGIEATSTIRPRN